MKVDEGRRNKPLMEVCGGGDEVNCGVAFPSYIRTLFLTPRLTDFFWGFNSRCDLRVFAWTGTQKIGCARAVIVNSRQAWVLLRSGHDGVVRWHGSAFCGVVPLVLHASVLEPNFDLPLSQIQGSLRYVSWINNFQKPWMELMRSISIWREHTIGVKEAVFEMRS